MLPHTVETSTPTRADCPACGAPARRYATVGENLRWFVCDGCGCGFKASAELLTAPVYRVRLVITRPGNGFIAATGGAVDTGREANQ